jgi:hypothetical protein
VFIDTWFKVDP